MQTIEIARYRVVVEVTLHNRLEPLSGLLNRIMRAVQELLLDFLRAVTWEHFLEGRSQALLS